MASLPTVAQFSGEFVCKRITKTDKNKGAIVVTKQMKALMAHAGFVPESNASGSYTAHVGTFNSRKVSYTFYDSLRISSAKRRVPETRIGMLTPLLDVGDELFVIRNGSDVHFYSILSAMGNRNSALDSIEESVASGVDLGKLFSAANRREKTGGTINQEAIVYRRNPVVQAFVKKAAKYKCQMPRCSSDLFKGDDGKNYVEVHHILPLSQGGADSIENCASLCPSCHREVHLGKDRERLTEELQEHMVGVHANWKKKYGVPR